MFIDMLNKHFLTYDNKSPPIEFPDSVKNNFLKILTNIFYLNIRAVYDEIKADNFKVYEKSEEDLKSYILLSYEKNLKFTREKVLNSFAVEDNEYISAKTYLRYYAYSLHLHQEERIKYKDYSSQLTQIEENLTKKKLPKEFVDNIENNPEIKNVF